MEFDVICPYYIPEKIGYLTKKDNYSQIYLESQEDINLRDLVDFRQRYLKPSIDI